jgi:hypothetical protein
VEERAVSEGEMVKAGQPVARLDRSELVEEVASPASQIGGSQCRFNFCGPQGLEMCNLCLIRLPSRSS